MIQGVSTRPPLLPPCPEAYLISSAAKELGAFMCAIRGRYGSKSAETAGRRWVTELETADWDPTGPIPDWRRITMTTLTTLFALRLLPLHVVEKT